MTSSRRILEWARRSIPSGGRSALLPLVRQPGQPKPPNVQSPLSLEHDFPATVLWGPKAWGRQAWLFAGSDCGGERAAAILFADYDREAEPGRSARLARRRAGAHRRSPGLPPRRIAAVALT